MNELTREEATCFRTALALVVVKKRLEQKQQKQQQPMPPGDQRKRSEHHSVEEPQKIPAKKLKLQTMDSLIFPSWAAATAGEDDDDEGETASSNDNDTNQRPVAAAAAAAAAMTPARLQQAQSKQAEHLQSMMDTAIRTALCLVPESQEPHQQKNSQQQQRSKNMMHNAPMTQPAILTNTANYQQQQAAWSTLEALSLHLAQQVSFALKVAKMPTAAAAAAAATGNQKQHSTTVDAKKKMTPKSPPPSDQWVADWVRDSLRQLLTQDTSPRIMDAAFLVWHGILLGGFSISNAPPKATSSMTPNYPACQSLFRQVFCDLLQELGIVRGSRKSRRAARTTTTKGKGTADDTSTVTTIGTSGSGSDAQTGRRDGKRVATNTRVASVQRGGRSSGNACHERMDQWLVHGLQLLQKLAQSDKKNADNGGDPALASTSRLLHCLHPNSFLPPTDLVKWYTETKTRPSSRSAKKKKARQPAPEQKGLGPGATLMTMVSLYQALKDE